jgi:hypothetical protein
VRLIFDDGHSSGIFSWDYLYELGENADAMMAEYAARLEQAGSVALGADEFFPLRRCARLGRGLGRFAFGFHFQARRAQALGLGLPGIGLGVNDFARRSVGARGFVLGLQRFEDGLLLSVGIT